jgi:alcohol dehydrogenase class IV
VGLSFAFRTAGEIAFGPGESRRTPDVAARLGRRVFLVTGARSIENSGFPARFPGAVRWTVAGEPDVALVDEGARRCREAGCDVVVGAGGGSALDAAKAVAALAVHEGSVVEYLEEVGGGRALDRPPLPFVAVPTTAGSGSEATRNAVIRVPGRGVKRSLRHDRLLPRVAIVDPELSGGAPLAVAAAAGLDALTHLVESYLSTGAQPTTDALAVPGARLAYGALRALAAGKADASSRESMALASLWGGIALANAGLGAVHGLVAPLGGRCAIAHGNACACLLEATFRANLEALRSRAPSSPALPRLAELASALGESSPESLADALGRLRRDLGIPSLSDFGFRAEDVPAVVKDSRGSSMKFNPVALTDDELAQVLEAACR